MLYTLTDVLKIAGDLFPRAKERMLTSLETPQIGPHHNEGPTLSSHLDLMLQTAHHAAGGAVEHVSRGSDEEVIIINSIKDPQASLEDFKVSLDVLIFICLHDLFKQFTMSVKTEKSNTKKLMTWEAWKKIKASGEPYLFNGSLIKSISYYLPFPRKGGLVKHGELAKDYLVKREVPVPARVLKAIGAHDEIYLNQYFETPLGFAAFVKRHDMDDDDLQFLVAVTYIDRMSALAKDGKPKMDPFFRVLTRYKEYAAKTAALV